MPNPRVIYIVGFGVEKFTGRAKATLDKAAELRQQLGIQHFRFYHPASSRYLWQHILNNIFFDLRMAWKAMRWTKDDILVLRQAFLPLAYVSFRLRGLRTVAEVHAVPGEETSLLQKNIAEKFLIRIMTRFEYRQLSRATGIICNHPFVQSALNRVLPVPSIWCYNGANSSVFVVRDRLDCRKRLQLDADGKYLLFLGEIARWRGMEMLIELFRQPAMKEFILLIVGWRDNSYGASLKQQASSIPNIIFRPLVPREMSIDYINASDIGLVPVNSAIMASPGNPIKLYDLIACGKPVITQIDTTGYSDEVTTFGLGTCTDFTNPALAAEQIQRFFAGMDSPHYREHNRLMATTTLSWETRMKRWISFLETV